MNVIHLKDILDNFELSPQYELIRKKAYHLNNIGKPAGTISSKGYIKIQVNGKMYPAHRMIYQLVHSIDLLPSRIQIDHIDGNKQNNNPNNLRIATNQENQRNVKIQKNNTSGFKGVSYEKDRNKWKASISDGSRKINLGRFNSPEEAHVAYKNKAIELFGEFARY